MSVFGPLVSCNKSPIQYPFFNDYNALPVFFEVENFRLFVGDKNFPSAHLGKDLILQVCNREN